MNEGRFPLDGALNSSSTADAIRRTLQQSSSKHEDVRIERSYSTPIFPNGFTLIPRSLSQRGRLVSTPSSSQSLRSMQVVPQLSSQELEQQGFLFSSRDFCQMTGRKFFFNSPQRVRLLKQLDGYHEIESSLSHEEKIASLEQLEQTAQVYYGSINSGKSTVKDQKATELLLHGIALEKQKLLCEDSKCQPYYEELSDEESSLEGAIENSNIIAYVSFNDFESNSHSGEDKNVTTRKRLYCRPESLEGDGEEFKSEWNGLFSPQSQQSIKGYFKAVGKDAMTSSIASELGIPKMSTALANLSGRAVATYRMSQLLGLSASSSHETDLVPETNFAFHNGQYGSWQVEVEGRPLTREIVEEQKIPTNLKVRNQKIVDVACGGLILGPEEGLVLKDTGLHIDENGCVCENSVPISRRRASELVEQGTISLDSQIITRFLERDLEDSIIDTIRGETALTLHDLQLKDPHLSLKKDSMSGEEKIFENDQPITNERAYELVSAKKIVRVKNMIASVEPVDFRSPPLQKEMASAQLLDLLTGNISRSPADLMYQHKEGQWHMRLITNDHSFPSKLNGIDYSLINALARSPVLKLPPRLVDKRVAQKILSLTEQDIAGALQGTGLSREEIKATQQRLVALKSHLHSLAEERFIDNWNDETYQELMKVEDNYIYQGTKSQELALESMKAAQLSKL